MTGIFWLNFLCAWRRQETAKRVPTRPTGLLSKQVIYANNNKLFPYETSFLLEHCHVYCPNKLLQTHFVDSNCCCCCCCCCSFFFWLAFFPIFFIQIEVHNLCFVKFRCAQFIFIVHHFYFLSHNDIENAN